MTDQLQLLIDKLDELMAIAQTSADASARRAAVEAALNVVCEWLTKVRRRLKRLAEQAVSASNLPLSIKFRDAVFADDAVPELQSKEALADFLDAAMPALVAQRIDTSSRISAVIAQILRTYDAFMELKVGVNDLHLQFAKLKRFFCRPPGGGSGDQPGPLDPDSGGGSTAERVDRVRDHISAFATIASFLGQLFGFRSKAEASNDSPFGSRQELVGALTGLLGLAGFALYLDSQEEIPDEDFVPESSSPALARGGGREAQRIAKR